MASREQRLSDLVIRIAAEFNTIKTTRGDLATLSTTNQSSLVAAINEVKGIADAASGGGAAINDLVTNTTNAWSSSKIAQEISTAIDNVVNGAPAALDTLNEIATALQDNDTDIASILSAQANRVRFDASQTLTALQQAQARSNIGAVAADDVGDTDANFVTIFNANLS